MSAPLIFNGRRAKMLTQDGILRADGSIIDNNGIVNLIKNGHAEVNTTGWSTYADAAGTRPVDGTGGSPTVTWTRSTTSPLSGQAHFLFTKDASNRQGEGASYAFTVPTDLKAKVVQIELDYMIMSGTFVAGSSSADSDLIWYIYDVTNSVPIEPSSIKLLSNSSTLTDKFIANFQTSATGTSYRLICHVASTSASAYTLAFKNILVKPCQYVYGTPITDWASYTPTLTGTTNGLAFTNSSITGKYRRVGDSAEISIYTGFTGAPGTGTGNFQWSIPSGLSIDTNKTPITSTLRLGFGQPRDGTTTFEREVYGVVYASATTVTLNGRTDAGSSIIVNPTTPFTVDANTGINLKFSVPITGWSSSVQVSDGYDGRFIGGKFITASGSPPTSLTTVNFGTTSYDSTASYSSGTYTVPSSGWYKIYSYIGVNGATVHAGDYLELNIRRSGSVIAKTSYRAVGNYAFGGPVGATEYFTAGQTIDIQVNTSGITTPSWSAGETLFTVEKTTAPTTMSATAVNTVSYQMATAQTLTSTGIIKFDTKLVDTFAQYSTSTGLFSVQEAGIYEVSFQLVSINATSQMEIRLRKNQSTSLARAVTVPMYSGGTAIANNNSAAILLPVQFTLNAGDTLDVYNNAALGVGTLYNSAIDNILTIKRIK